MTTVGERVVQWLTELAWIPASILPEDGQECWTALSNNSVAIHQFYKDYAKLGPSWQAMESCGPNLYIDNDDILQVTHWQPFIRPPMPKEN